MAEDLLSLADASVLLGVSAERVRQLVARGQLPGVRFGNAWAVPRDAVVSRRHQANRRGRPFGAKRAWEEILSGDVDLGAVGRYCERGEIRRFLMSRGDLAYLAEQDSVLVSGVVGAVGHGELLAPDGSESAFYLADGVVDQLLEMVAAVPSPLGPVVVRVVPDDAWALLIDARLGSPDVGSRLAPRAAVALDLMESGDPRHWEAAGHLVGERG